MAFGALSSAYLYSNPSPFGGIWEIDANLDATLPVNECACQEAAPGVNWQKFQKDLRGNLQSDPSFSRPWVHELCSATYSAFFATSRVDEATFQIWKSTCGAGLLAVAAVCSQSIALQMADVSSRWRWTERPVQAEGRAVKDILEAMPAGDCLRLCEEHEECASVAHGPFGCHLKDKCVTSGEQLVLPGVAPGYRTYYQRGGPCTAEDGVEPVSSPHHLSEIRLLMDAAVRLLDHVVHCLDKSDWPFTIEEVLANRMEFTAATLHAHRNGEFYFRWSRSQRFLLPVTCDAASRATVGDAGAVCRTLSRLMIRWVRGLDSEVGFWHALLDPSNAENPEVDFSSWRSAQDWLLSGDITWHYGDICTFLAAARGHTTSYGRPRVLNAGSGPLAPGRIDCGDSVTVVASDGLARFYLQLYDILQHDPPVVPLQCPTEALHHCFPQHHFDVVHMRNSLDHANDPLMGILELIWVARPGGWVLLRHARNEGVAGHFQLGLHQWAFDVEDRADGRHFVIWSPSLRVDVSDWLLSSGLAAEVKAERRPHPAGGEEEYIFVDIQKQLPTSVRAIETG
ncbi:unnamed protein product [Durusdinium trenchii]|uniref:Leucine-rich repeat protein SHOC-2 n=2 Tax=Durusdinium trenchii TaxID=1381693 RepID=A0ABP0PF48_9DINO